MEQVGTSANLATQRRAATALLRRAIARRRWGHGRVRLPGRRRLQEFTEHPTTTLAVAARKLRPATVHRVATTNPTHRLVGLLMVRDEDDVLDDVLRCATQWFDRILVLDGTEDADRRRRTDEILGSFDEVVFVRRDADVLGGLPVRDGARQILLDEARRRYGTDQWIGVLHADEFIDQDPRPMLAAHNPLLDPTVRVRLVHAFLHTTDEELWRADPERYLALPIRDRVTHVMWPGVPETRFFFDRGDRNYVLDHHSKTVPTSFRSGPLVDGFTVVQYNERNPSQAMERAATRADSGWQTGHYAHLTGAHHGAGPEVFVESLDTPLSPFAPEYRGDPDGPFRVATRSDVPIGPLPRELTIDPTHRLATLVARPSRRAVFRWWAGERGSVEAAATMLLDHTARLLASGRLTREQRHRVAGEYLALVERSRSVPAR